MLKKLFWIIVFGWGLVNYIENKDNPKKSDPVQEANNLKQKQDDEKEKSETAAKCRTDLDCYGNKYIAEADAYCRDNIEKLSTYNVRWTDGAFGLKFSRVLWLDKEKGTLQYFGDTVEFQNQFGAYQNYWYACQIEPASRKIISVEAYPGRLPNR